MGFAFQGSKTLKHNRCGPNKKNSLVFSQRASFSSHAFSARTFFNLSNAGAHQTVEKVSGYFLGLWAKK
jgi:hypothetical protein